MTYLARHNLEAFAALLVDISHTKTILFVSLFITIVVVIMVSIELDDLANLT